METLIRNGLLLTFLCTGISLEGQDAQWRGPERTGSYPDAELLQEWPDSGPDLVLKKEGLGAGWTTPVISDNVIYISGRKENFEVLSALSLEGELLWETIYGNSWQSSFPDSRNSPTIEGDRIFIAGAMGKVNCIEKSSGRIIWEVNTHEIFNGEFHRWGYAESLVITEKDVISSPTGSETVLVALDKKDGSLHWKTKAIGGVRAYASPVLISYKNRKMILAITSLHILAVDPENGDIIWKYNLVENHPEGRRNHTNTPLYKDGKIFITSGYDTKAVMLKLSEEGNSVKPLWTSDVLDTHHGGVVLVDGYIYGSNWLNNGNGNWVCLDWETGKSMYEEKWFNKGSLIYADNRLYIYEEKQGHVGLVEPDPSGFKLISSFRVEDGNGPHWAHPSIYNGYLLLRHGEVLMVYDIQKSR